MDDENDRPPVDAEQLVTLKKLTRDLRDASKVLSKNEARFLADAYYAMQNDRIRAAHQERTLSEGGEPCSVMSWLAEQRATLERQVANALNAYSAASPLGEWARSICGIGPIITAGLLAHIDITRAPTVGHIWRFGGMDPTVKWEKGKKRPWNADLKRLLFLVGESFVKVSGNENDVYGQIYKARKVYEIANNEALLYADQAKASLAEKKFGADTDARKWYEKGMLPPARIHLRAKRYAVKHFLSDYHAVGYWLEYGRRPPKPWIIEIGGHVHYRLPPNLHLVPGLEDAMLALGPAVSTRQNEEA